MSEWIEYPNIKPNFREDKLLEVKIRPHSWNNERKMDAIWLHKYKRFSIHGEDTIVDHLISHWRIKDE